MLAIKGSTNSTIHNKVRGTVEGADEKHVQ
jgi:hypothetical protein